MTLIALTRTGCGARVAGRAMRRAAGGGLALALAAGLGLAGLGMASPAVAQTDAAAASGGRSVLLELYTSQGCASCPPADEMLVELAAREDVIALALHVDYWDYIGWPDTFADRAHTERQQAYARRHGHSTIYTPQVVVNGIELIEGFRTMQVMDSIAAQNARVPEVTLTLARTEAGGLEIRAIPAAEMGPGLALASRRGAVSGMSANSVIGSLSMARASDSLTAEATVAADEAEASPPPLAPLAPLVPVVATGPYVVQLVRYRDTEIVDILGGENAGRTATYANVVTSWQPVANWDMMAPLSMTLPIEGDDPVVVLIQEAGLGEVLAAARLR